MSHPVTIMVSRVEIVYEDVACVREILDNFIPTLTDRHRNRVRITVAGYDDDPRELFQINEVRK